MAATEVRSFLEEHETVLRPLFVRARLAAWEASTTGDAGASRRAAAASAELRKLYCDAGALSRIRAWLRRAEGLDPLSRRQLVRLEHEFTANQLSPELIDELEDRAQEIEQVFHTFRGEIAGREVSDNEIRRLLAAEADTPLRREAWEASKAIGPRIAGPLRELARRRNDAARTLGFPDYYTLQLTLQEVEPAELDRITADVGARTGALFEAQKAALDQALAERMDLDPGALRPWHYADPFFQEPPAAGDVDLDPLFRDEDVVMLARRYFAAIGLPIDDVLERSDLFERPGKDQHAFCIDVDREADVRVLCNVRNDTRWMGTMLHELGHAAYDRYLPRSLPFLLRAPAHTMSTEAVAMFFGALVRDADWLTDALSLPAERGEALASALPASRARHLLVFARWALVMIRFERAFYQDPDRADLNDLWWRLTGELQGLAPPSEAPGRADWATKIHFTLAPVYYHNYLLGELFAAQLRAAVERLGCAGPALGAFFRDRIFRPGATIRWDELVRSATGEPLTARDLVRTVRSAALPA